MALIVTGGAGLIGSAIVWELNCRNITDIIVVDHLGTSEKWRNLTPLKFNEYYEKDEFRKFIHDGTLGKMKIHGIIHMGACSSTTEKDASYLIDNNFNYTKELASFACANDIRFVYASSCATYGDGSQGYCDDDDKIERLRPLNMYGYSKQLFDLWAMRHDMQKKITGCKFSNVYGPNEYHKGDMRSVVLRAYEQISTEGKMRLFKSYNPDYADGEFMRDFLYVKDAVKMVLHLFENPAATGLFNIGSNRAETWNALATAAFEALNMPVNIEYIEMPESLRAKYQYYTKAETAKIFKYGWQKEATSLKDSVKDYIQNYLVKGIGLEP